MNNPTFSLQLVPNDQHTSCSQSDANQAEQDILTDFHKQMLQDFLNEYGHEFNDNSGHIRDTPATQDNDYKDDEDDLPF